jgi:hypothetical protein
VRRLGIAGAIAIALGANGCSRRGQRIEDLISIEGGVVTVVERDDQVRELASSDPPWRLAIGNEPVQLTATAGRVIVRRAAALEGRDRGSGEIVWQRTLPQPSEPDAALLALGDVVALLDHATAAFFDASDGAALGRHAIRGANEQVVTVGNRVFVGGFPSIAVFERGARVAAYDAWGGGCVVGEDFVFVQRDREQLSLIRLRGGVAPAPAAAIEGVAAEQLVGCFSYDADLVLVLQGKGRSTIVRLDRHARVLRRLELAGSLAFSSTRGAREGLLGIRSPRHVPLVDVAAPDVLVLDVDRLEVVARTRLGAPGVQVLRSGDTWYVAAYEQSLAVGRIDGVTGSLTAVALLGGDAEPSTVRIAGGAIWATSRVWAKAGAAARLDATTLVALAIEGPIAVAPGGAFARLALRP